MYLDYYLGKSILTFLVCQGCRDQAASPKGDIFNFTKPQQQTTFSDVIVVAKNIIIKILRKNKS